MIGSAGAVIAASSHATTPAPEWFAYTVIAALIAGVVAFVCLMWWRK